MSHPNTSHDHMTERHEDSKFSKSKALSNRTVTGHWGHETISRPKTMAERHPNMFKPKHKALTKISKEDMHARFVARHGGAEAMKKKADAVRQAMNAHKASPEPNHADYQRKYGRAYND